MCVCVCVCVCVRACVCARVCVYVRAHMQAFDWAVREDADAAGLTPADVKRFLGACPLVAVVTSGAHTTLTRCRDARAALRLDFSADAIARLGGHT